MTQTGKVIALGAAAAVVLAAAWLARHTALLQRGLTAGQVREFFSGADPEQQDAVPYVIEEFASGLDVPWSMAFTSPSRMLVSERSGSIRVIENGALRAQPLHTFAETATQRGGEEGLMSIVLDPAYETTKTVYAALAYEGPRGLSVKIVRFRDDGDRASQVRDIIDDIPAAKYHAGTRLLFGPDGMLYVSTGDATDRNQAQDIASLAGKILRFDVQSGQAKVPEDNPFPGNPVWSYGHRNPQGLAWHPYNEELYSSEHGPSVIDGPAGGDEINRIVKGGNYGWPLVSHDRTREGTVAPLRQFTPAEAPASLMAYAHDALPQFKGDLFFGALVGEGLVRLELNEENPDRIIRAEKLPGISVGRIRDVIQGPEGCIYFSTSNRDGRGSPRQQDDRIIRLCAQEAR